MMSESKVKWGSRLEFVVALIGISFGLPDIWRLPYLAYRNGGGAFLIAYILLMLLCGTPLYFLEISMSQYSGKGPWRFWDICPVFRGFGIAAFLINLINMVYDTALRSWIIEYLVNSFRSVLPWTTCTNTWNTPECITGFETNVKEQHNSTYASSNISTLLETTTVSTMNFTTEVSIHPVSAVEEFWKHKILRISSGIDDIGDINGVYVGYYVAVRLLVFLACAKSVKSLGKVMYVTALLPVILTIIIWIRAMTLPGSDNGMRYFVTPDFTRLASVKVWTEAAFMTFYTLGPGWGCLMMAGCHNTFKTDCFRAAVGTVIATLSYGLLNGLVVFSVLGVMAEEAKVDISDVITSGGFSIGFIAYPKALSYLPLPQLWCVFFFVSLLLTGLDAMCVEMEPVMLILEENFQKTLKNRRPFTLAVISIFCFLLGLPFATKAGVYMFQLVDWYVATWSIMFICIGETFVFSWIYGGHRVSRDLRLMLGYPLPALIRVSCAFIMPLFLVFLLLVSVYTYRPPSLGAYHYPDYATAIGWCFALVSVVPIIVYAGHEIWRHLKLSDETIKGAFRYNSLWMPASSDVKEAFIQSEQASYRTWRELLWFNLTGKGAIDVNSEYLLLSKKEQESHTDQIL